MSDDHDDLPDLSDDLVLRELRAMAGRADAGVTWEAPPPDLFGRIEAALADDAPGRPPEADPPPVVPPGGPTGGITSLDERRASGPRRGRGPAPWLLAVAAATALIAGGWWLFSGDGATVVAETALERLGESGEGRVELVDDGGAYKLRLDTEGLDAPDGFVEVWVIDDEVSDMISLGPLRDDGVYDLPSGLEPASFPIVDVSFEPFDGDPTHSGDSVLRGRLDI